MPKKYSRKTKLRKKPKSNKKSRLYKIKRGGSSAHTPVANNVTDVFDMTKVKVVYEEPGKLSPKNLTITGCVQKDKKECGSGTFGTVYTAIINDEEQEEYALKISNILIYDPSSDSHLDSQPLLKNSVKGTDAKQGYKQYLRTEDETTSNKHYFSLMVKSCPDEIAKIYAYGYLKKISYDTLDIPVTYPENILDAEKLKIKMSPSDKEELLSGNPDLTFEKLYGSSDDHPTWGRLPFSIMEKCEGGDLEQNLKTQHYKFSVPVIIKILKQIAIALNFIHDNKFIYYDLKPENIVFIKKFDQSPENSEIRLIDFGHLTECKSGSTTKPGKGTYSYNAPEILNGYTHTNKVDVFSFGILILDLCFGLSNEFYMGYNNLRSVSQHTLDSLIKDKIQSKPEYEESSEYKELLELAMYCLKSESKERLTFREVLEGKETSGEKKEEKEKINMPPKQKQSSLRSFVTKSLRTKKKKASPTEQTIKIHIKGLNEM